MLAKSTDALPSKKFATEPIDMYAEGHTVTDAPKLPLNMLDALREYDKDAGLKAAMGEEFSAAYLKMKKQEWMSFTNHFSRWEKEHTLDV
nr:glutamine synthetase [Ruegeria conchae]